MEPKDELEELEKQQIGLDRSKITHQGQIQLPSHSVREDNDKVPSHDAYDYDEPKPRSLTRHMVDSIKERKHDARIKIKQTLHLSKTSEKFELPKSESPILASTVQEISESRLVHKTTRTGEAYIQRPRPQSHRHC